MMTNLIMWGSIIWIIPLVYFMQKNETKFKKKHCDRSDTSF